MLCSLKGSESIEPHIFDFNGIYRLFVPFINCSGTEVKITPSKGDVEEKKMDKIVMVNSNTRHCLSNTSEDDNLFLLIDMMLPCYHTANHKYIASMTNNLFSHSSIFINYNYNI